MHITGKSPATTVGMSPIHGRGVFAARNIESGEWIGDYPLLVLSAAEVEAIKQTALYRYVFHVDEDERGTRCAVVFGDLSLCNHSTEANTTFSVMDEAFARLTAITSIPQGDEIFIDYEAFAEATFAASSPVVGTEGTSL